MSGKGILFQPVEKHCEIGSAQSVLEVAITCGVELAHSCGGMGSCTTCRVYVVQATEPLPDRNELEQDLADMRGFAVNERLACQLPPMEGLVVRIPAAAD